MFRLFVILICGVMTAVSGLLAFYLSSSSDKGLEMAAGMLLSTVLILMGVIVAWDNFKKIRLEYRSRKMWDNKGLWVSIFD